MQAIPDMNIYDNSDRVGMSLNVPMQASGTSYLGSRLPVSQSMMLPVTNDFEGIGLGLDENAGQHYFQDSHPVNYTLSSNEGVDMRRMSQPELQNYVQRPVTPTQQTNNSRFPLTPATTPFRRVNHQFQYPRTAQSSPTKNYGDETIKASHQVPMQRGRSLQSIFEGQVSRNNLPSPPGTAPMVSPSTFDVAMMPTPGLSNLDDLHSDAFDDDLKKAQPSSPAFASSPAASSAFTTPELPQSASFDDNSRIGRSKVTPRMLPTSQTVPDLSKSCSPSRTALSPRRMSISDLNLEPGISASITETDVTLDDIAQFIEGPDPVDNKWVCKYEDCDKRFGRKENIKSHVQTHLGDRQFKCDHCGKCFVRGHDLKRHAKIHSGAKPYPCLCGNAFARHDALTRHRQRGMCIGAFDGVVKKVMKRGRPRKHRPDMEDRLDKASKTRERVDVRERQQYASSISDSSVSSYQSPPAETFENLSIRGSSPFDDMTFFSSQPTDSVGFPPDLFTFTPPASPGFSTGNKPSPVHRSMTPTELTTIPELPISPVRKHEVPVTHQSPAPSLCHSSSPMAEPGTYDFVDGMMQSRGDFSNLGFKDVERTDFDSFFDYGAAVPDQDDFFAQL